MGNILSQNISVGFLLKFAMPTVIMSIFMNFYTMVDGIFVSRLVGTDALSAVNLVSPFLMLICTIGIMLASGGSAVIAKKMGEGKSLEAKQNFSLLVFVGLAAGFIILILGRMFTDPLIQLLGADKQVAYYCYEYVSVLMWFMPPLMLQVLFQAYFVTAGKSGIGLVVVVIGGVTNIVLDYIFIALLDMGMVGAALATGLGYSIPGVLGLFYFILKRKGTLYIVRPKMDLSVIKSSLTNGSSEMVSNLAGSITIYLFNISMMQMLGSDGVAAISVILYADALLGALYFGYSMGVAPIISFNYGEQNKQNLRKILKISITVLTICSIVVFGGCLVFSDTLVSIFAPVGSAVFELASHGMPLFAIAFLFKGVNIFASAMFTALSNGKVSATLSFLRTFVFLVIGILVFPHIFGVTGLWVSVPFAEILAISIALIYYKKLKHVYLPIDTQSSQHMNRKAI